MDQTTFERWLICLEGKSMTASRRKHYSLPFRSATLWSPSWTLEGLFELTRHPSRTLNSPRVLLPELQRYEDTVRCVALGAGVPVKNSRRKPWLCVCCKRTFLQRSLIAKSQQNDIELVTRPGHLKVSFKPCRKRSRVPWDWTPWMRLRWQMSQQI